MDRVLENGTQDRKMEDIVKDFMEEGGKAGHAPRMIAAAIADCLFDETSYVSLTGKGMEEVCVESMEEAPMDADHMILAISKNFHFRF